MVSLHMWRVLLAAPNRVNRFRHLLRIRHPLFSANPQLLVISHEGINVIIGPNNAGKSNLLAALGLIFDSSRTSKLEVDDFNRDIVTDLYFEVDSDSGELKEPAPPKIEIAVTITESTGDNKDNEGPADNNTVFDWRVKTDPPYEALLTYEFFLPEGEETRSYEEAVKSLLGTGKTSAADYWNLIERKFIQKYISRIYGGPVEHRNKAEPRMLNRFDFQYLDAIRDAERYLLTGRTSLLKEVLSYFLDYKVKIDEELSEDEKLATIEAKQTEFQKQAGTLINNVRSRVDEEPILKYSKDVGASLGGFPGFEGEMTEVELLSALRLVVEDELGIRLPATHNGLGYNNLIYISILLAKMQMSASNYVSRDDMKVFPMLLIEEPEAHLHPSMQFKFLRFLKQNIKKERQVRQVFVTTHSTHITAAVDLDEIICLNVKEDGKLDVAYPGGVFDPENENDKKSKAYVKRFLDATKSDMLFAKRVIFVEGIAEQLLMSCLANYEGVSLEDNHVSVVNVGGRYFFHFLKLFDYEENDDRKSQALQKKVVCLTDADPAKKDKTGRARLEKCFPHELAKDPENFNYHPLSANLRELVNKYSDHINIKICSRNDGKGKTFEYDLAFANPGCSLLLTAHLSKRDELEALMEAYRNSEALDDLIGLCTTTSITEGIDASKWEDDEAKKRALIAARYLTSIENSSTGGKGAHALELEYKLRANLENGNVDKFQVPEHIIEAINHVCE